MKNNLQRFCDEKGLTIKKLAARTGYAYGTAYQYVRGERKPSSDFLQKASAVLQKTEKEILAVQTSALAEQSLEYHSCAFLQTQPAEQLVAILTRQAGELSNAPADSRIKLLDSIHEICAELKRKYTTL